MSLFLRLLSTSVVIANSKELLDIKDIDIVKEKGSSYLLRELIFSDDEGVLSIYAKLYVLAVKMFLECVESKKTFSNYCEYRGLKAGEDGSISYGVMIFPMIKDHIVIPIEFDLKIDGNKITLSKHY